MRANLLSLFLMSITFSALWAGTPTSIPLEIWAKHSDTSQRQLNSRPWGAFLAKYLDTTYADKVNRIRYGQVSKGERRILEDYLSQLQAEKVSALNRPEQKAYWINLYNAMTVAIVLRAYPVKSILDINLSQKANKSGPWEAKVLGVEGQELTLNDIENKILRPLWKDNRIHFALNCASLGCPNLAPIPYTAKNSESLLDRGVADFVQSARGSTLVDKTLLLSSIFDWYKSDFGSSSDEIQQFISRFSNPEMRKKMSSSRYLIQYQYDWKLNDTDRPVF